eukprot:3064674-Amphidinium_carterae.1
MSHQVHLHSGKSRRGTVRTGHCSGLLFALDFQNGECKLTCSCTRLQSKTLLARERRLANNEGLLNDLTVQ